MNPVNYTFLVLASTIVFFVWGKIRSDLVALISMLALFFGGVLNTGQILGGFSNSTVVMIAALFVVGEGLSRTGVTASLSRQIIAFAGNSPTRILVVLMTGTALLSAFISNTGTVATLLPAVVAIAWSIDSLPSKLLIPLAFAANTGGLLTLTGTPPNIVVSDALANGGFEPFAFFEYAYIGLPLLIVAIVYMVFIGSRILPSKQTGDRPEDLNESMESMADSYVLKGNLFIAHVAEHSSVAGKTLAETAFGRDYSISVLQINREEYHRNRAVGKQQMVRELLQRLDLSQEGNIPDSQQKLRPSDLLLLKGDIDSVEKASQNMGLSFEPVDPAKQNLADILVSSEVGVAEVLVTPRSIYNGKTVKESGFLKKYGVYVMSIIRRDKPVDLKETRLHFGDAMLVRGRWDNLELFRQDHSNFTVVGSPDDLSRQVVSLNRRAFVAVLNLVCMIIMMVFGIVPTVVAALIAAIVMVLGGCLDMDQAYRSMGWQSVILIACMIPLSTALETTGGARMIADSLVGTLGAIGPTVLLAGVFMLTAGFSQVINNTATAVLMAPVVMQAAEVSGLSPYPLLIIVSISASTAFLTPIGTTTNLMVMTPGGYSFNDYAKVGLPLMVIFMVISLILVPLIWPF